MASPLLTLLPELRAEVFGYLTYVDLRALGATCTGLGGFVDAFFADLRLSFPDPARSSALQIGDGLTPDGPRFIAAVTYMLDKGAVVVSVWAGFVRSSPSFGQHLFGLLKNRGVPQLRSLFIESKQCLEQLGLAGDCPELRRLRVGELTEDGPWEPFAMLGQLGHLESFKMSITAGYTMPASGIPKYQEIFAHLPIHQLRSLRLSLNGIFDMEQERIVEVLLRTLPTLEVLQLEMGRVFPIPMHPPWEPLAALRELEGFFAFDSQPLPVLRALRHLSWGYWGVDHRHDGRIHIDDISANQTCESCINVYCVRRLLRLLAAATTLSGLSLSSDKILPSQEILVAITKLGGTLRRLNLTFYQHEAWDSAEGEQWVLALIRGLPHLTRLSLSDYRVSNTKRFPLYSAAAACSRLRVLNVHVPMDRDESAEREGRRRAGELIATGVLGHPDRVPRLPLRLSVHFKSEALEIAAAVAAADPRAADYLRLDWSHDEKTPCSRHLG